MEQSQQIHIGTRTKASAIISNTQKGGFFDELNAKVEYLLSSIGIKEKVVFFRLMATMINAGVTITQSMVILSEQIKNPKMTEMLKDVKRRLERGEKLSEALSSFPNIFSDAEIGMIRAGESSGKLNVTFLQLSEQVERSASIQRKVKGAMIYPSAVLIILILAFYGVMIKVVPTIKDMFSQFNSKLPPLTEALIAVGDFINGSTYGVPNSLLTFGGLVGTFLLFQAWRKSRTGKPQWEALVLKIPVFGPLIQKSILAAFCRNITLLISSGLNLIDTLRITASALGNEPYKRRVLMIADDLKIGISIGDNLKDDEKFFPSMLANMIAVGEKTAQLGPISQKVAEFYEDEVNSAVEGLSKVMEPLIIVIVGGFVAFLVGAIMLPIMNLSDLASGGS